MVAALLTERFLLELLMLAAYFAWGYAAAGILGGIGATLLVAVVWGLFLSPKATVKLSPAMRTSLELVVFLLAAAALASRGHWVWGVALVVADIVVLAALTGDRDHGADRA